MTPFQNPTIYIGGLRIDEPVTTITDFLFVGVCVFAFFKTASASNTPAQNLYRWFFLLTGISTFIAALIGHTFLYYFGNEAKIYGWITGVISISFSQFAAIHHVKKRIHQTLFKFLIALCCIEIVIASIAVFWFWTFKVVEIHTAFSLVLIVGTLELFYYKKTKSNLSLFMLYGVGALIIAVLCHVFKIAFSVWFNHADLAHIFMAISMYLMYLGVSKENRISE